ERPLRDLFGSLSASLSFVLRYLFILMGVVYFWTFSSIFVIFIFSALGTSLVGFFARTSHIGTAFNGGNRAGIHRAIFRRLSQGYRRCIRSGLHQPVFSFTLYCWNPATLDWWFLAAPGPNFFRINFRHRFHIPGFATTYRTGLCLLAVIRLILEHRGFCRSRWHVFYTHDAECLWVFFGHKLDEIFAHQTL